ncbi:recombinase family protein [Acetobacter sp.]|uniref:recombinase family protein n=1 Tax=Acetobacter sp. TaxID=440 RepID=UPI0039EA5B09
MVFEHQLGISRSTENCGSKTGFMTMQRYGYTRVSTNEQTNDPQVIALKREGLSEDMIVRDIISGGVPALSRPGMSSLLQSLQPGDSLIAAKLDRLGRDTLDVIGLIRTLNKRSINLRILNIGVETNTPNGRLFLTILAGFAEFEREIIRERTVAGLEAARAAGKRLGRRPKLTDRQRNHVLTMSAAGQNNGQIADILGVSISTIQRITAQNTLQKAAF